MKAKGNDITKKKVGLGIAAAGAVAGAVVAGVAAYRHTKSEQVYHEAELKAMSELDDMNAENESTCEACECADACAAGEETCEAAEEQLSIDEQPEAEEEEAPAEAEEEAEDAEEAPEEDDEESDSDSDDE